jgi:transposase
MTKYREIIRLKSLGFSERNIALSCSVSRNTVAKVVAQAQAMKIFWPLEDNMTDAMLEKTMFPKNPTEQKNKRIPDFEYIRKELIRQGVTKKLLWIEYCEDCRMNNETPLMYSQYCHYIQQDEQKRHATMRIPRKPGEQVEVDWAGDPAFIIDPDTGKLTEAWLFVGVMTFSQYAYVEAFVNEKQKAWILAHIHMFEFFGGIARILVSDNCATAVNLKKSSWNNQELNTTYREMAEHYGTAIIPARVRKPKDKPNVESCVGNIATWITAALRNEQFFSLAEINTAIKEKVRRYNANTFQKKEGSRIGLFLGEEKPLLAPLPATRFELADWKIATVQFNYHIAVEKMHYSVPYNYIKNKVDVRITETTIEVFLGQDRIASHKRLFGRPGQYSTVVEHMPTNHQKYLEWNGERFRKWAKNIGTSAYEVTNSILASGYVEQQTYKSCMGLLRLAEKHSDASLEEACKKALLYSSSPSYKSIKNLLTTMKDKQHDLSENGSTTVDTSNRFGITRGAKYYGGKQHD